MHHVSTRVQMTNQTSSMLYIFLGLGRSFVNIPLLVSSWKLLETKWSILQSFFQLFSKIGWPINFSFTEVSSKMSPYFKQYKKFQLKHKLCTIPWFVFSSMICVPFLQLCFQWFVWQHPRPPPSRASTSAGELAVVNHAGSTTISCICNYS